MTDEERYLSVRNLLLAWCRKAARRFGTDLGDALGVAHVAYAEAAKTFAVPENPGADYEPGPWFANWVQAHARRALWQDGRREESRKSRVCAFDVALAPSPEPADDRLGAMTGDARELAAVALEPPAEVGAFALGRWGGCTARRKIRAYMEGSRGWSARRVSRGFRSVREALR